VTPIELEVLHAKASESPWSARSFEQQLAPPGAILATHPHAFALGCVTLDEAELLQIATDPSYQRKGYGRMILDQFETLARERDCTRLLLEVAAHNAPAIALYTGAGWQRDGVRAKYYRLKNGQRADALLMSKSI